MGKNKLKNIFIGWISMKVFGNPMCGETENGKGYRNIISNIQTAHLQPEKQSQ